MTTRRNSIRLAALAGLCLHFVEPGPGVAAAGVGAWPNRMLLQPVQDGGEESFLAVLFEPSHDPAALAQAAEAALERAQNASIARRLTQLLQEESQPQEPRLAVLAAVGRSWSPPPRLYRAIHRLAQGPTNAPPAYVLPALAAYRTPEGISLLIKRLSVKEPEAVRIAASEALIAVTGRDDLGGDRIAWQRWFDQNRSTDDSKWRDTLAAGVSQRQARLAAERGQVAGRMTDALRRLYLALPSDSQDRAKLLTQLLTDPIAEARNLGLDLLSREVSAGRVIDGASVEAVAALLESSDPRVRARAALFATQLVPANLPERLAAALGRETSPEAAASLLIAAARWPSAGIVAPTLRWLEQGPVAYPGAIDAVLALHNNDLLTDPADIDRVLAALRGVDTPDLTPAACRLLSRLGGDEDRQRIAALLDGPASPARSAAAEALAEHPSYLDRLLAAATTDASLFEVAVAAVVRSRPTADGFAALALLPVPDAETRREGLLLASLELKLPQLLRVARDLTSDAELRDSLLARLTDATVEATQNPDPEDAVALIEGLYTLAETRIDLRRPRRALAALATLPDPLPEGADAARARRLRTVCLLWANQIQDAAAQNAPVSDWLEGLELAIQDGHASDIVIEIRRRFSDTLTPAETERLEALARRIGDVSESSRAAAP